MVKVSYNLAFILISTFYLVNCLEESDIRGLEVKQSAIDIKVRSSNTLNNEDNSIYSSKNLLNKRSISSNELFNKLLKKQDHYRSSFVATFDQWFKTTFEAVARDAVKILKIEITNTSSSGNTINSSTVVDYKENDNLTTSYDDNNTTSFSNMSQSTSNITNISNGTIGNSSTSKSEDNTSIKEKLKRIDVFADNNSTDQAANKSVSSYNKNNTTKNESKTTEVRQDLKKLSAPLLKGEANCTQMVLKDNVTVFDVLEKKQREENPDKSKDFASRLYKHLLQVEQFVRTEDDDKYINLSSIVKKDFRHRLRYANEEVVNQLLQILPDSSSNDIRTPEMDDCLLRKTIARLKLIHRITALLILSLPWSVEDILSTREGEWLVDYVFRPMAKSLFDGPCLGCYSKFTGRCMEIFLCKQGSSIESHLPYSFSFP